VLPCLSVLDKASGPDDFPPLSTPPAKGQQEMTMDTKIAQKRVNDLAAAMVAKGMREPHAQLDIASNVEPQVYLRWKSGLDLGRSYGSEKYEFIKGSVSSALDKAAAFVAQQPDAEQAKLQDFMSALGKVIDIGNQHGIEADYLNPLVASMKKLSENIITDQRAA
jgi:hypothetical protein